MKGYKSRIIQIQLFGIVLKAESFNNISFTSLPLTLYSRLVDPTLNRIISRIKFSLQHIVLVKIFVLLQKKTKSRKLTEKNKDQSTIHNTFRGGHRISARWGQDFLGTKRFREYGTNLKKRNKAPETGTTPK